MTAARKVHAKQALFFLTGFAGSNLMFTNRSHEWCISMEHAEKELICVECGEPYSTVGSEQYLEPPYDYRKGAARYCLACWLGVGLEDQAD